MIEEEAPSLLFLMQAAHELKGPIAAIRGFAEILHDYPERAQEIAGPLTRASGRLERIVQALLSLADVLRPEKRARCDLALLAASCKDQLLGAHPEARVRIVHDGGSHHVLGEGDLLEIALMNLLENGVRYSAPPACIDISLSREGDHSLLSVQDRGAGIPEEHLPHIFDRFYSADPSRSRKLGGVGLGLSLVQAIAKRHQGDVSVLSTPNEGSTFILRLPHEGA